MYPCHVTPALLPVASPPCSCGAGWPWQACARGPTKWPTCTASCQWEVRRGGRLPRDRMWGLETRVLTWRRCAHLTLLPTSWPFQPAVISPKCTLYGCWRRPPCAPRRVPRRCPLHHLANPPFSANLRSPADPEAPAIFLGSHYDTVHDGGKFDGALGIVAGIAAVKAVLLEVGLVSHGGKMAQRGCDETDGGACGALALERAGRGLPRRARPSFFFPHSPPLPAQAAVAKGLVKQEELERAVAEAAGPDRGLDLAELLYDQGQAAHLLAAPVQVIVVLCARQLGDTCVCDPAGWACEAPALQGRAAPRR